MAEWSLDLSKYCDKQKHKIKEVRKAYAFGVYSSIVKKTPVDTGRARGNWQITVGQPAEGTTDEKRTTPKKNAVPDVQGDESIFITNNLPYITMLEFGGYGKYENGEQKTKANGEKTVNGYSKQAPNGMVGVTLANNENIVNSAIKAVEGK